MEEYLYMFIGGDEWEDMVLFTSKEEAIEKSIQYPKQRVEVFQKKENGFVPTYCYYEKGVLVKPSHQE